MNKKGFTLVEVLGVIVLITLISIIVYPIMNNIIIKNREKLYKEQINNIEKIAYHWSIANDDKLDNYSPYYLSIDTMKKEGYLKKEDLKDIETEELLTGCVEILWNDSINQFDYLYDKNCDFLPTATMMAAGSVSNDSNMFLDGPIARKDIKKLSVVKHKTVPEGYTSWDVSQNKDESVLAWYNSNDTAPYDIYIGGKRGVLGYSNSKHLFAYLTNLIEIDLNGLDTQNVTSMESMFFSTSKLTNLNLSHFNTSKVTNMLQMFYGMANLTDLNVSSFDTSKVTSMFNMFSGMTNLTSLNISNFNTSNVTSMSQMFYRMTNLTTLDLSNFDTSNVVFMDSTFRDMSNLTTLNISNFNTSNVTSMLSMFYQAKSLTTLDLSNFDTSNVTNMNGMFRICENLTTLNISSFDTSKVTDMSWMFYVNKKLTNIDFRNATFGAVTNSNSMFYQVPTSATIYVKDNAAKTFIESNFTGPNVIIP